MFDRPFDTHAAQWNYGLYLISSAWALCLDADYRVTPELRLELEHVLAGDTSFIDGVVIPFQYLIYGRPLRQCIYPAKVVMFRPARCHYVNDGHTQVVDIHGPTLTLRSPILHDDRKPLSRWFWAQERYARLEVEKLLCTPSAQLRRSDRLRLMSVLAPFANFFFCLLVRQGLLDGWRGWFYAFQRLYAETLLSLMLWEARQSNSEM